MTDSRVARERSNVAAAGSSVAETDVSFVHRFDTDRRDLERSGHVLELHERNGSYFVVASGFEGDRQTGRSAPTEVQIDRSWAVEILAEAMSPLTALERRLGGLEPSAVEEIRWIAGGRSYAARTRALDAPQIAKREHEPRGKGTPHFGAGLTHLAAHERIAEAVLSSLNMPGETVLKEQIGIDSHDEVVPAERLRQQPL